MKKLLLIFSLLMLGSVQAQTVLLAENFDDVTTLTSSGWTVTNQSNPIGGYDWFQGDPTIFESQTGGTASYISADFGNCLGAATGETISNWLISPSISLQNGDVISFYSRAVLNPAEFADRLELRLSTNPTTTMPVGETSVGSFTTLALTINPNLTLIGYPEVWTKYSYTVSGIAIPANCKVAFRYFVTDAGGNGTNSDTIGIDTFAVTRGALATTNYEMSKNLKIYPNPAINNVTIELNKLNNASLQIIDITGKEVFKQKLNTTTNTVNIEKLTTGTYLFNVNSDTGNTSSKVIKN